MPGEKLRLASLSVLGGSLHGRRREIEEVVGEVLVGSDPDCHLVVDLPSISPIHARLWTDLDEIEVNDTRAPRGVYVNTRRVEGRAVLRPGDVLWLGPPQDPGSVCVQCRFEPWVEVLPGSGAAAAEADVVVGEEAAEGADVEDATAVAPSVAEAEPVVVEAAETGLSVPAAVETMPSLPDATAVAPPEVPPAR